MAFLTHFQFPVHHETGTHFLTSLKQDTATCIFDHIHEWRHQHHLIKFEILDELLTKWFTNSFINKISKDIAMGGCVTENQDISHARYLDLVYSKSSMLYEMLLDAPRPYLDLTSSTSPYVPPIDGIIGLVYQTSTKASSKQKTISNTSSSYPSKKPSNPGKTYEVNVV